MFVTHIIANLIYMNRIYLGSWGRYQLDFIKILWQLHHTKVVVKHIVTKNTLALVPPKPEAGLVKKIVCGFSKAKGI